jgi:hypothetical protein
VSIALCPNGALDPFKKTLPRVFLHGSQRVFPVLLALVLVEQGEDFPSQLAGRIVTRLLGNGEEPLPGLYELALVKRELQRTVGSYRKINVTLIYKTFIGLSTIIS